jgi:hypothetical protein
LAIQFFRGIGANIQKLAPFRSFTFFVGANNVGKSTALDCLHRYVKHSTGPLNPSDEHGGDVSGQFTIPLAIPTKRFIEHVTARLAPERRSAATDDIQNAVRKVLADGDFVWVKQTKISNHGETPRVHHASWRGDLLAAYCARTAACPGKWRIGALMQPRRPDQLPRARSQLPNWFTAN